MVGEPVIPKSFQSGETAIEGFLRGFGGLFLLFSLFNIPMPGEFSLDPVAESDLPLEVAVVIVVMIVAVRSCLEEDVSK